MRPAATTCFAATFVIAMSVVALGEDLANAQDPNQSLKLYAATVLRMPRESWTGFGVYMGNGVVLTAAHVVSRLFWVKTEVDIGGKKLPAQVVKSGSFTTVDLATLSIDDQQLPVSIRLRRMKVCDGLPAPGELVFTATPDKIAESHVIDPRLIPKNVRLTFRTAIADVATTGASGSGVFDATKKCLLGIVSGKIQGTPPSPSGETTARDIAKFFVPAPAIKQFISQGGSR